MMIIYDPSGYGGINYPWCRSAFDGCHGDRKDPGLQSWFVPGTIPSWML